MSEQIIFSTLINAGMTVSGACAIMGNMMAESSMKANIAQRGMTSLSDEQYTNKFDTDPASCFNDGVGFGLCQWTYYKRKENLSKFAKTNGKSVGDEDLQVAFCIKELKEDFSILYKQLCTSDDLYALTEAVCEKYENPAVKNNAIRCQYAEKFYQEFSKIQNETPTYPPDPSIAILQLVLAYNGFPVKVTGYKDTNFNEQLEDFCHAIGAF